MVKDLEKFAHDLIQQGYVSAGIHFLQDAADFKQKGQIPESLVALGRETSPLALARRGFDLAARITRYPKEWDHLHEQDKTIALMTTKPSYNEDKRKTVLHSLNDWFQSDLGSGGIAFEAEIEAWRRERLKERWLDAPHLIGVGLHTEEETKDRARAYTTSEGISRFETAYHFNEWGDILKLSLMPIDFDTRPDFYNSPIHTLGMKSVRTGITAEDLRLMDKVLEVFEAALPKE